MVGEVSPSEVLMLLNDKMIAGQWVGQQNAQPGAVRRAWKFADKEGGMWSAKADAQAAGSKNVNTS